MSICPMSFGLVPSQPKSIPMVLLKPPPESKTLPANKTIIVIGDLITVLLFYLPLQLCGFFNVKEASSTVTKSVLLSRSDSRLPFADRYRVSLPKNFLQKSRDYITRSMLLCGLSVACKMWWFLYKSKWRWWSWKSKSLSDFRLRLCQCQGRVSCKPSMKLHFEIQRQLWSVARCRQWCQIRLHSWPLE